MYPYHAPKDSSWLVVLLPFFGLFPHLCSTPPNHPAMVAIQLVKFPTTGVEILPNLLQELTSFLVKLLNSFPISTMKIRKLQISCLVYQLRSTSNGKIYEGAPLQPTDAQGLGFNTKPVPLRSPITSPSNLAIRSSGNEKKCPYPG